MHMKIYFSKNTLYRIISFELTLLISIMVFASFTNIIEFNRKEILSILISVISIIVAIIVTFLFSKLFAEKATRIERKQQIDFLSLKITSLRKIAFHIRSLHEFWKFPLVNLKSVIDHKYRDLTYEKYRGSEMSYEEFSKIDDDIFGTNGQAYLALKGLENNDNSFSFFAQFNPTNYSLDDIERFKEYTGSVWYMLENTDDKIVNFNSVNFYHMKFIEKLYFEIKSEEIDKTNYKKSIKDLFNLFTSEIFEKHYFLNELNSDLLPLTFRNSLINMLVFIGLLIISLFTYIIDINIFTGFIVTTLIVSFFISNTVDLVIITVNSIINELDVQDIYQI